MTLFGRRNFLVAALALVLAACGAAKVAPDSDKMVILTITGDILNTNRGPLDEFKDAFLGHKGAKFDRAFQFTRESLAALGEREAVVKRANWPAAVTVRGPTLKSVLSAAKAEGDIVEFQALDGYLSKFLVAALQSDAVILAIEADGAPLPIGGHGPTWLVYPAGVVAGDDASTDAGLAWSVFHIDVQKTVVNAPTAPSPAAAAPAPPK
jgi:hypothetical protein